MEKLLGQMALGGDTWKDTIYETYLNTIPDVRSILSGVVTREDLYGTMGRWVNISKFYREWSAEKDIVTGVELQCGCITGHPDVVTSDRTEIYDIKTATKFDSQTMQRGSILQLTAYYALATAAGHHVDCCGIILPFQQIVLEYYFRHSDYDYKPFLDFLVGQATPRLFNLQEYFYLQTILPVIGSHCSKIGGKISSTISEYYKNHVPSQPCQFFTRGNRGAKSVKVSDADVAASLALSEKYSWYIHAPYSINLCHPSGRNGSTDLWATRTLAEELQIASSCGGKGVVVHTGKGMGLSDDDAYDAMYNSILSILDSATETAPLLIETPCDKGTELCGTVESFANFYLRFSAEERKRIGVCIDTCHVYAAGYLPSEYLKKWDELVGAASIKLIHLNDAQWARGSSHDGHAWLGKGCIGLKEMLKVVEWCFNRDIPMVHE